MISSMYLPIDRGADMLTVFFACVFTGLVLSLPVIRTLRRI
jgi:hypothetical protein